MKGIKVFLFSARRAETALAPDGVGEFVLFFVFREKVRSDYELSDSFALRDGLSLFAVIVERDFDFSAIIAVDNPDLICGSKPAFARQSRRNRAVFRPRCPCL